MDAIAQARFPGYDGIPDDLKELFKFSAFGIPRSFLMMLRDYQTTLSQTTQQKFNKIIERYVELRLSEYSSLKDKLPRLFDIVSLGESLLLKVVELLKESNSQ